MRSRSSAGFTLVELMMVVLVIGILVATAIPVYTSARARSQQRACFANQRTIIGAVQQWVAGNEDEDRTDLVGVIDDGHPLVHDHILGAAPRCPSAPEPATPADVDVSTGAYTLPATGAPEDCTWGTPAHGGL